MLKNDVLLAPHFWKNPGDKHGDATNHGGHMPFSSTASSNDLFLLVAEGMYRSWSRLHQQASHVTISLYCINVACNIYTISVSIYFYSYTIMDIIPWLISPSSQQRGASQSCSLAGSSAPRPAQTCCHLGCCPRSLGMGLPEWHNTLRHRKWPLLNGINCWLTNSKKRFSTGKLLNYQRLSNFPACDDMYIHGTKHLMIGIGRWR